MSFTCLLDSFLQRLKLFSSMLWDVLHCFILEGVPTHIRHFIKSLSTVDFGAGNII